MATAAGLQYEWYGDGGLPPVVLAAGFGGLASWWEPNVLALAQDYHVLAYDARGTGASGPVEGSVTVEGMAADIAALLAALGVDEPVGLVGHGLGGLVALQLAMDVPAAVQRLLLVNSWGSLDPHTARVLRLREQLLRHDPALDAEAAPLFLYPPAWISEHDAALREAPPADPAPLIARMTAAWRWAPGAYRLGLIEQRTLCLGVEDDQFVPVGCSEALAAMLPGGQFASLASGGHAVSVTRPQEFVLRVQDWLR